MGNGPGGQPMRHRHSISAMASTSTATFNGNEPAPTAERGEESQETEEEVDDREVDPSRDDDRVAERVLDVACLLDLVDQVEAEQDRTGQADRDLENRRVDEDADDAGDDQADQRQEKLTAQSREVGLRCARVD